MLKENDINLFKTIVNKPGMFLINKVEDFNLFLLGYGMSHEENDLYNYIDKNFTKYIKHLSPENHDSIKWWKIIRYNSSTDSHSLDSLREFFISFLDHESDTGL